MILGVFNGIAEYLDWPVFWIRIVAVFFLLTTGLWPILGLYLLAALIMKPAPVLPLRDEEDQEFYNSLTASRKMAVHRLKKVYDQLDRRLRRLEDVVTSKEYFWGRKFDSGNS
ncbi:MAG: PspC domain-containing protein [Syntrophales bacterium LBB04]|nr:PspC domain-containing protein [Syntrophales bacterium LBB04]